MTKSQMTNLIGAGTLATIMLILVLAFGGFNSGLASGGAEGDGFFSGVVSAFGEGEEGEDENEMEGEGEMGEENEMEDEDEEEEGDD